MNAHVAAIILAILLALFTAAAADARSAVGVSEYSQEGTEGTSAAGASITYTHTTAGATGSQAGGPSPGAPGGGATAAAPVAQPASAGESLGAATPVSSGESSGSTGSTRLGGKTCPMLNYPPPCLAPHVSAGTPAAGAARPARPAVSPVVAAERVAARLSVAAGAIQASPKAEGLTGAASWFWLEPAPSPQSLSISLGGESVSVTASAASVAWTFGDGAQLAGGPGVAYHPGSVPAGAVLHTYRTRCLPGDQGHDPYVLASCGPQGYQVRASVVWGISYRTSGRVSASGALPSRVTSTSIVYPVSEARAFLTSGTGAG